MKAMRIAGLSVMLVLLFSNVYCSPAANKPTFEVLSTAIVVRIDGVNGKAITWADNTSAQGCVLLVKVTTTEDVTLWNTDFNLAYAHGDKADDRTKCSGITTATSSADEDGIWLIGDYNSITVKKGVRYFKLLVGLENDVSVVNMNYSRLDVTNIPITRKK